MPNCHETCQDLLLSRCIDPTICTDLHLLSSLPNLCIQAAASKHAMQQLQLYCTHAQHHCVGKMEPTSEVVGCATEHRCTHALVVTDTSIKPLTLQQPTSVSLLPANQALDTVKGLWDIAKESHLSCDPAYIHNSACGVP